MPTSNLAPKPVSKDFDPQITGLPRMNRARRWMRCFYQIACRLVLKVSARVQVHGIEHFPLRGPALIVTNHLGDADIPLGLAYLPVAPEVLAKTELRKFPFLGWLMDAYGVIWLHRGHPDRKALREALHALDEGRFLVIAPEGRESLTGSLEVGTGGAAFLAIKSGVTIVPVTFTGTENWRVMRGLLHLQRLSLSLTIGSAFQIPRLVNTRQAIRQGTETIMHRLAAQLPVKYQGFYTAEDDKSDS
jgi:1-acyl-sn-glycerol-3-phosphate acyltransferase